jgi:hypothetical protein
MPSSFNRRDAMNRHSHRRQFLLAACAAAALAAATGARAADQVEGRGAVQVQTRTPGAFTAVRLSVPAQVVVRTGEPDSLAIETDANLLPLIETAVVDGALEIRLARGVDGIRPTTLRIVVHARRIDRLAVAGSGRMTAESLHAASLQLDVAGTGSISAGQLRCDAVAASLTGSGAITLDGEAPTLSASVSGSGDLAAGRLRSDTVHVSLAGSGHATVWAAGELNASLVGSGDLRYYGHPRVHAASVGGGAVRRVAGSPS